VIAGYLPEERKMFMFVDDKGKPFSMGEVLDEFIKFGGEITLRDVKDNFPDKNQRLNLIVGARFLAFTLHAEMLNVREENRENFYSLSDQVKTFWASHSDLPPPERWEKWKLEQNLVQDWLQT
jgi:hypothetical protein